MAEIPFSLGPKGIIYDFDSFQLAAQPADDSRWKVIVSRNGSDLGMDVLSLESAAGRTRLQKCLVGASDGRDDGDVPLTSQTIPKHSQDQGMVIRKQHRNRPVHA